MSDDTAILERIAIALEQLVLEYMDQHPSARAEVSRPTAPSPTGPVGPEPPPPAPYTTPPPAPGPIPQYQTPVFVEGSIHAQGHNPLKMNRRGLFCPTKLQDGSWCQWKVAP